jgi:predicted dehydrogenase
VITLAFLGTGWIGRNRMDAMLATGGASAVAICDPDPEMAAKA